MGYVGEGTLANTVPETIAAARLCDTSATTCIGVTCSATLAVFLLTPPFSAYCSSDIHTEGPDSGRCIWRTLSAEKQPLCIVLFYTPNSAQHNSAYCSVKYNRISNCRRMTARQGRKDLQEGMQKFGNLWDSVLEKNLDPAKQRSVTSLLLGAVPHLVILAFTVFVVWTAKPSSGLFSWHPTLMSLAFVLLMSEAILMFSPWSSPILTSARSDKARWHWVLQACAAVSMYTGLAVITCNKFLNDYPHYTSWHGTFGVTVCGTVAIQISGGIIQMYPDILPFKLRLVTLKRLHAFFGMLTYFGGLTTLTLGLYTSWFVANVHDIVWKLCFCCPMVLGACVLVQVARNHFSWMWRR